MNPSSRLLALAALSILASGCSVLTPGPAPYTAQADQVGVYESSPPGSRGYKFVTRLWVEPWKSAIRVPRYRTVEDGVADLRAQTVARGGDAIVNFACYHIAVDPGSDYICNGTVIKYAP
jgi:hypothetical protein